MLRYEKLFRIKDIIMIEIRKYNFMVNFSLFKRLVIVIIIIFSFNYMIINIFSVVRVFVLFINLN